MKGVLNNQDEVNILAYTWKNSTTNPDHHEFTVRSENFVGNFLE